ncbi:MAG: glutathione S-transferase family protein [Alphaproteobacteria bacterium]|nr:glutathione S-transferase family protein [Alphaproteobacteria bacterium]
MTALPRLWGRASSVNVQKVMWALTELDLAYDRIDAGFTYGQTDTDSFATMNPTRRVPVWQDSDLTLFESNAILRHLGRSQRALWPKTLKDQAIADQWMEFASTTWQPPVLVIFYETVRLPPDKRSPERLVQAVDDATAAARVLDGRLAQSEWLSGDGFTMADITAGALMHRYVDMSFERVHFPYLDRWRKALEARAPYRNTVQTSYEELRG